MRCLVPGQPSRSGPTPPCLYLAPLNNAHTTGGRSLSSWPSTDVLSVTMLSAWAVCVLFCQITTGWRACTLFGFLTGFPPTHVTDSPPQRSLEPGAGFYADEVSVGRTSLLPLATSRAMRLPLTSARPWSSLNAALPPGTTTVGSPHTYREGGGTQKSSWNSLWAVFLVTVILHTAKPSTAPTSRCVWTRAHLAGRLEQRLSPPAALLLDNRRPAFLVPSFSLTVMSPKRKSIQSLGGCFA